MSEPEGPSDSYYPEVMKDFVGTGGLQGMARTKPRTRLERLKDTKRGIEQKLKEINDAIEALESNPEITRIMELVERAGV